MNGNYAEITGMRRLKNHYVRQIKVPIKRGLPVSTYQLTTHNSLTISNMYFGNSLVTFYACFITGQRF